MKKFYLSLMAVLLISLPGVLKAQESCTEKLVKANIAYEKGNFTEAISLASSCTNSELTSDRWKAYRLLAIAYLANNQKENALDAAENMLKLNPTYKPSTLNDPGELVQILKKITVLPKFNIGLAFSIGPNSTYPRITSAYAVNGAIKKYTGKNSFLFGLSSGYNFTKNIAVEIAILSSTKVYEIRNEFTDWNNKVTEKLTYLDIPLNLKFSLPVTSKLNVFAQIGVYGGYLLFANNDFASTFLPTNLTYSLLKISSLDRRNRNSFGITAGAGISYLLNEAVITLKANYFYSMVNITKTSSRYRYNELIYTYYYLDDDIYLNNLAISIGYAFNLNYKVVHKR